MKHILYVEDSVTSQLIMRRMLAGLYDLQVVISPKEALKALEEQIFDLVITDYLFPDDTGMDVIVHIRQRRSALELPIVAVSGSMDAALMGKLMNAGANACASKPLAAQPFRALVNEMLLRPRVYSSPSVSCTVSCFQWYEGGQFHEYCPELKILLSGKDGSALSKQMRALLEEHATKGDRLGFTAKEALRQYLLDFHGSQACTSELAPPNTELTVPN